MEIVGVLDVDKVQSEFLSTLRQPDKISAAIDIVEELHTQDDSDLLIFYVPEVHRSEKPVYLNGDIRRAFVRSGGCDVRCSDQERNRFLIDAAAQRPERLPSRPRPKYGVRRGQRSLVSLRLRGNPWEPFICGAVRYPVPGRDGLAGQPRRKVPTYPAPPF